MLPLFPWMLAPASWMAVEILRCESPPPGGVAAAATVVAAAVGVGLSWQRTTHISAWRQRLPVP